MFGLWVSAEDWQAVLKGVPMGHAFRLQKYLRETHYLAVKFLHVSKRYKIGRPEGLDGKLSANQSLCVAQRYVALCEARQKNRRFAGTCFSIVSVLLLGAYGISLTGIG